MNKEVMEKVFRLGASEPAKTTSGGLQWKLAQIDNLSLHVIDNIHQIQHQRWWAPVVPKGCGARKRGANGACHVPGPADLWYRSHGAH